MSGLEELLANATPGPWANYMGPDVVRKNDYSALRLAIFDSYDDPPGPQTDGEDNARLAALAPDLARISLEMAHRIKELQGNDEYVARLDGLATGEETAT